MIHTVDLQGYSYEDRQGLLPSLTSAFTDCGGWVLERKTVSANSMEIAFEIQLSGIVELYSSLLSTGVELTTLAHAVARRPLHLPPSPGAHLPDPVQVLSLRLMLNFLEDVTLQLPPQHRHRRRLVSPQRPSHLSIAFRDPPWSCSSLLPVCSSPSLEQPAPQLRVLLMERRTTMKIKHLAKLLTPAALAAAAFTSRNLPAQAQTRRLHWHSAPALTL